MEIASEVYNASWVGDLILVVSMWINFHNVCAALVSTLIFSRHFFLFFVLFFFFVPIFRFNDSKVPSCSPSSYNCAPFRRHCELSLQHFNTQNNNQAVMSSSCPFLHSACLWVVWLADLSAAASGSCCSHAGCVRCARVREGCGGGPSE